jgi:hypothetical protein
VLVGPQSGYLAMLHGKEYVFPEDQLLGKISSGGMAGAGGEQLNKMNTLYNEMLKDTINLEKLTDQDNRSAQFRTVISLIWEGREYLFEGICKGRITEIQQGVEGFGYDPIFIPDGAEKTFATIALIISFGIVNNQPFILLDEIDTFLDLWHTEKIFLLLKDLSKNSQLQIFIITLQIKFLILFRTLICLFKNKLGSNVFVINTKQ